MTQVGLGNQLSASAHASAIGARFSLTPAALASVMIATIATEKRNPNQRSDVLNTAVPRSAI